MNKTLVYVEFAEDYINIRTVSRLRKSPHRFYIFRRELAELEHQTKIVVCDICSFAVLCRDKDTKTVRIEFTWLENKGSHVYGYQETIVVPYNKLAEYTRDSDWTVWKTLSIDDSGKRPRLVFKSGKNLREALENRIVKRKLIRFLRDHFRSCFAETIEFHDDLLPYSFIFKEIKAGEPIINGGLILHSQENLKDAYYSIHT